MKLAKIARTQLTKISGISEISENSENSVEQNHNGLFCPILQHLDITLVITQKYDQVESYNLVCS